MNTRLQCRYIVLIFLCNFEHHALRYACNLNIMKKKLINDNHSEPYIWLYQMYVTKGFWEISLQLIAVN